MYLDAGWGGSGYWLQAMVVCGEVNSAMLKLWYEYFWFPRDNALVHDERVPKTEGNHVGEGLNQKMN